MGMGAGGHKRVGTSANHEDSGFAVLAKAKGGWPIIVKPFRNTFPIILAVSNSGMTLINIARASFYETTSSLS